MAGGSGPWALRVTTSLRELASELRADIVSVKTIPALSAGFTAGLGLLVSQVAFGSFIFSGVLASYSSQGVGLILFGNFAACLLVALLGGYRGAIAGLSPALVIVMATIATTMEARGQALFVTAASALVIGAIATGLGCLMIGHFRLANLVRFIPYPVAAGFVSGIGGAVCLAAMSLMGANPGWQAALELLEPAVLWTWLPGAAYGLALYAAMKRWGNALILPVSVVAAVCAYHLVLGALEISGDEARTLGLLLTGTADGGLWPVLVPADLVHLEWAAITGQIPNILTLMLIAFICVIMSVAGLEVSVNQELDWNREFKASGLASIVAGLGGGTVATLIVPASLRSKLFKATTRWTGVVAAAVIGTALFLGDGMLELVPTALIGGVLIFAGLGMLDEGLVRSRTRLPWSEFGIILVIFVIIIFFGLIEGVGAGMVATLAFFAVRLSRVDPIETRFTARERHSNKARPVPDRAILMQEGERVQVYRLRGYIFFGSVGPLIEQLRRTLEHSSHRPCLLLDFAAVSGFDVSAVSALSRFLQTASKSGATIVLSATSEQLRSGLALNLPASVSTELIYEPSTDRALEHCEDVVLAEWRSAATPGGGRRAALLAVAVDDLERQLERQIHFEDLVVELGDWLTPRDYAPDEVLAEPDAPQEGLQLLISGRASACDETGARLHQFSPGDAIGPVGAAGMQPTSVVADGACRTLVLTPHAQRGLETNQQRLALKLYRYLLDAQFGQESDDEPPPGRAGDQGNAA